MFLYFFLIDYKIENNYNLIFLLLSLCSYIVDNYRKFYIYKNYLFYTILILSFIECVIAILFLLFNLFYNLKLINFSGNFDNSIRLSSLLVFTLPFDLYIFKYKKIILVSVFMKIVFIFLSFSRTSALATLAIVFIHYYKNKENINWNKLRKYIWIFVLSVFLFYYLKIDSANGRILIWIVTIYMISQNFIFGYGVGGFQAKYMNFQSCYLRHIDSEYFKRIADDVIFPYNEYLNIIVDFGFVGMFVVGLFFYYIIKYMKKVSNNTMLLFMEVIVGFSIISLFSYPLYYLSSYAFICLSIAVVFVKETKIFQNYILKYFIVSICVITIISTMNTLYFRYKWGKIFSESVENRIECYASIYSVLNNNYLFLNEYAIILNKNKCYTESNIILSDLLNLKNSYEIQMLFADNYIGNNNSIMAIECLDKASYMCPNRFLPLYKKMNIYIDERDYVNAISIANNIVDKDIKVESNIVAYIKKKLLII